MAFQLDQCDVLGLTSPIDATTSIGTANTNKPRAENGFIAMRFKYRRIAAQIRMGLRALRVLTISRRRHVAVEINDFRAHIHPKL